LSAEDFTRGLLDQHIEVLRELGFARMIVRSGKQYELG